MEDQLFKSVERVEDFVFDERVAGVFDDMIRRSVPFYDEVQRMVVELGAFFLEAGGTAYDLGCSIGTTIAALAAALSPSSSVRFVGIDSAPAMLEQASQKLSALGDRGQIQLVQAEVQDIAELPDARVVIMLYTLQFVRPIKRLGVLRMIKNSLSPGGCLILAEKVIADQPFARRLYIDLYHHYKHNKGYSDGEISKKREALENVLIPFQNKENIDLLHEAGFVAVEQAFRWYNFSLYIAV
jgi:tRNA (cmo5U34)-methyltransferase